MNLTQTLTFKLFGFPVRIHFTFWIMALLLGLNLRNPLYILLWVVVVFIAVLVHELGHALLSARYGRFPGIELRSMGGVTVSARNTMLTHGQEILLSLSGPFAGFALGGVVFLLSRLLTLGTPGWVQVFVNLMMWANIAWGVFNLLPILPLDGGNVMRHLWLWLKNPYDERTPLKISIGVGVLAVIAALFLGMIWGAILAVWMTFNNYMALTRGIRSDIF